MSKKQLSMMGTIVENQYKASGFTGLFKQLPAHEKAYSRAKIIERVTPNFAFHRLEREDFWIRKLETKSQHGLNLND